MRLKGIYAKKETELPLFRRVILFFVFFSWIGSWQASWGGGNSVEFYKLVDWSIRDGNGSMEGNFSRKHF